CIAQLCYGGIVGALDRPKARRSIASSVVGLRRKVRKVAPIKNGSARYHPRKQTSQDDTRHLRSHQHSNTHQCARTPMDFGWVSRLLEKAVREGWHKGTHVPRLARLCGSSARAC